ncbi:MAG: hypothetical protein AAF962_10550 [Actinomycetota bacterium]
MTDVTDEPASMTVTADIAAAIDEAIETLARPGSWLTAAERLAIAERARSMFALRATPPWLRDPPPAPPALTGLTTAEPGAVAIVDMVALDAARIDRAWAEAAVAAIGEERYVELTGVVATVVMLDVHAQGAGVEPRPLPVPIEGDPSGVVPDGLGDIGAHVRALDPFPYANVARALSLVPDINALFRTVMIPCYSAPGFDRLRWDTPLSRPQVELVASRVAAMNECFY